MRSAFLFFAAVFVAAVTVTDAVKDSAEALLRREMPEPLHPHEERERIERQARWAERLERHAEGPSSAHEDAGGKILAMGNPQVDPIFDTGKKQDDCLEDLVAAGGEFAVDKVCNDSSSNSIKDDHGNYIRYTMNEDRVSLKIWEKTTADCERGETYLRDIVEGFGSGASCFVEGTGDDVVTDETTGGKPGTHMISKDSWKITGKKIVNQSGNEIKEDDYFATYRICEGGEDMTKNRLKDFKKKLAVLVKEYDDKLKAQENLQNTCRKLYMAHADRSSYGFRDMSVVTRSHVCGEPGDANKTQCEQMEEWFIEFMDRNLFAIGNYNSSKKGRAARTHGGHTEKCLHEGPKTYGKIRPGNPAKFEGTTNHGITTEVPDCTVNKTLVGKVLNQDMNIFKGGVYLYSMSDNLLAKHFAFCDAPWVAGVSGSVPQYIMFAGGSPAKIKAPGYTFVDALNDKELMALVGMLELAGFHSITELIFAVNFYRKKLLVTPPFDSGDFTDPELKLRCHDTTHDCCKKEGLVANDWRQHNGKAYEAMMQQFETAVDTWQAAGSFPGGSSSLSSS